MVKLIESGPWNMVFSSDIKGVTIEARPIVGLNGLMIQYHLRKGLNYAVVGDGRIASFNSTTAANNWAKRHYGNVK